jgi:hypothetical protein
VGPVLPLRRGFWHPGWSVLDVSDPEHRELLRFVDGPPNTMTIQVQVADGTMITALEHPPPGMTIGDAAAAPQDGVLTWDVHEPDRGLNRRRRARPLSGRGVVDALFEECQGAVGED